MEKQIPTAKDYIKDSDELKYKRLLMGVKANDFCVEHAFNQGNYSKMERGMANPAKPLKVMRELFDLWKIERLKQLKSEIKNLEKIL